MEEKQKKMNKEINLKGKKGITLIALVITVIVLLILAGVTVATLTGDNGLLQKTTTAKQENEESVICEKIKLAYGEWQIAQHTGTDKTAKKIIEDNLKSTYGDGITNVKVNNEKVIVNMNINNVDKIYIYKLDTGEAFEYNDLFDYKGKNKKDLAPGNDISLGTENFRVFYNKDDVIKAMPWYNITLPSNLETDLPIQSLDTGNINFSSSAYWKNIEGWNQNPINNSVDINMSEKNLDDTYKNNIQKFIDGYKRRLENFGDKNVKVRAPQKWELEETGVTGSMRWPGGNGGYWVGSAVATNGDYVWCVDRHTRKS